MRTLVCGIVMACVSFPVMGQSAMDNQSIIRLVRSGLSDELVVRVIGSETGNYAKDADSLGALRRAGVSDRVIAAMLDQSAAHRTGSALPPAMNTSGPVFPVHLTGATDSVSPVQPMTLRDGTPIRMRLNRTLVSEDAQVGQKVDFDVLDDIRVGEQVVIHRGTKAIGVITEAEHKKRMARGGKLNVAMEYITLGDGNKIALRAGKESAGGGHAGAMTAGIVASMFVAWPAAPLFLMMHGKSAVIPEATEITAYCDGDTQIPVPSIYAAQRLQ